jgi:3-deoxy-7-phosphoheptulonate synthase
MGNKRTIIRMQDSTSNVNVARLFQKVEREGCKARFIPYYDGCLVMVEGQIKSDLALQGLPGVMDIVTTDSSFPLASLDLTGGRSSTVDIAPGVSIGGGNRVVMAGPCAVENRKQIKDAAHAVIKAGATVLRGGAFKPRSNPYSFQGLGIEGITLLKEAKEETGLPIVTEVMSAEAIEWLEPHVDIFQVGARNMQNFPLLKALGKVDKPVLLKRGASATVDEWLQAAEYILFGGNFRVILCERGIRTFEPRTRNTLDLNIVPLVKTLSHLPIVVDPSHGTGIRDLVAPMSMAALAAGADGLIIEVHPRSQEALCDGAQSLSCADFSSLMGQIERLLPALPSQEEESGRICALDGVLR